MKETISPLGIRSLTPIQLALGLGTGLLVLMVGALVVVGSFNIRAASNALNAGYVLNDLAQIQRGILLLRIETEELVQNAQQADFDGINRQRAILENQLRLAIAEVDGNTDITDGLTDVRNRLKEFDEILVDLKTNRPTPSQIAIVAPELEQILTNLESDYKLFYTNGENQFFIDIAASLRTQSRYQTLLLAMGGLLVVFSLGLIISLRESVNSELANAYRLLEAENRERRRLFDEAQVARAAAERASHAKSAFLASMSHEIRTPLNAIIGFTRIVRRKGAGALPEKQVENLDKVLASAEHLLGLINTVLDIAKIEAGRVEVQPTNFDIAKLVDTSTTTVQPLIKDGKVQLKKEVETDLPLAYSDEDKVKQIMINLLSNAAKFTHEGQITVSARHHEQLLSIIVSDSGIGISDEDLGRIFEEFHQANGTNQLLYGGTGLGLSISRKLARLLGGDLSATSVSGQGSTFTLKIPLHYGQVPNIAKGKQA
jgi:signal transduction histidine kinase